MNIEIEIKSLEEIKAIFGYNKSKIYTELDYWTTEYNNYCNIDLSPDITVTDSFEGLAAEQLALDFPPMINEINNIADQMSEVALKIGNQISKIDTYIGELKDKIALLNSELEALG